MWADPIQQNLWSDILRIWFKCHQTKINAFSSIGVVSVTALSTAEHFHCQAPQKINISVPTMFYWFIIYLFYYLHKNLFSKISAC